MRVPLLSASYQPLSPIAAALRCVNMFPERNPEGATAPVTFYGTPGLLLWDELPGSGYVRMLDVTSTGVLFGVRGNKLYRLNSGNWTTVATLATTSDPVIMADNGLSAVFVDGTTTAPTVDLSTFAVGAMSGDGWYGADFVRYLDGFFIFNKPGTQIFYITGALNLVLDPLDFASAESFPDNLVAIIVDHRELHLFGEVTTEVFMNTGAEFPFERKNGAEMEMGCAAKHSAQKIDNSIFWLGKNKDGEGMVWRLNAGSPLRISTHALEVEIRGYETISDAEAWCYQADGHTFYVLTFPTANKTWCFDVATGEWHERAYRDSGNTLNRHRAACHVHYGRKHLVGDFENGNIYELDMNTFTDNGDVIKRIKTFQHLQAGGKEIFLDRLELDVETAVGSEAGSDPMASISIYGNRGRVLKATLTRSLGKIGEYRKTVAINMLGKHLDPVIEVSTTADARIVIQGAYVDARPALR